VIQLKRAEIENHTSQDHFITTYLIPSKIIVAFPFAFPLAIYWNRCKCNYCFGKGTIDIISEVLFHRRLGKNVSCSSTSHHRRKSTARTTTTDRMTGARGGYPELSYGRSLVIVRRILPSSSASVYLVLLRGSVGRGRSGCRGRCSGTTRSGGGTVVRGTVRCVWVARWPHSAAFLDLPTRRAALS